MYYTYLWFTWQKFFPRCKVLCTDNLSRQSWIAHKSGVKAVVVWGYSHWSETPAWHHCSFGVHKVQWGTEETWQCIHQFCPCLFNAEMLYSTLYLHIMIIITCYLLKVRQSIRVLFILNIQMEHSSCISPHISNGKYTITKPYKKRSNMSSIPWPWRQQCES